ncbi:MAG: hypothetical protein DI551_01405 [Micavibrio aeruginosavorus]|uniref:Uncharacterized protein n=1 Tax=Micavibrio aeruginosavorus TaxID=349221 RepID=A0A2W5N5B0_9BACT|nr:MAG: hypothetical protein DI551_01405 [Micavibrio aeruginosavorus]
MFLERVSTEEATSHTDSASIPVSSPQQDELLLSVIATDSDVIRDAARKQATHIAEYNEKLWSEVPTLKAGGGNDVAQFVEGLAGKDVMQAARTQADAGNLEARNEKAWKKVMDVDPEVAAELKEFLERISVENPKTKLIAAVSAVLVRAGEDRKKAKQTAADYVNGLGEDYAKQQVIKSLLDFAERSKMPFVAHRWTERGSQSAMAHDFLQSVLHERVQAHYDQTTDSVWKEGLTNMCRKIFADMRSEKLDGGYQPEAGKPSLFDLKTDVAQRYNLKC